MKKKVTLLFIILFIPFFVNAKTSDYQTSINKANNYITNFKEYTDYIQLGNMPYNYENSHNIHENKFINAGFVSKDEFAITNIYNNSYLLSGIQYWTLSQHSNERRFVIDYKLSDKDINSNSNTKITEFVKNEVKVVGSGTKNDPWYFLDVSKINLYSSDENRGTLSTKKCIDINQGSKNIVVQKYGDEKSVFYVCEGEDFVYYKSTCSNYMEHIYGEREYYISADIADNTICRIDFGYKTYTIQLEECDGCTQASPNGFYLAQNYDNYFEDKYGEKILTEIKTVPTKTGYTFEGYYTGENGTGNKIIGDDKQFKYYQLNSNSILHANMKANKYTVTLSQTLATTKGTESVTATYDADMEYITPPQRKHKITYNANGGTITKTSDDVNYTFNGYYLNSKKYYNGNGTSAAKWDVASNSTLTEKWSTSGINLPSGTRENYEFLGWYTSASGGTKVGDANQNYKPTSDVTLYAQWQAISTLPDFEYTGKYELVKDDDTIIASGTNNRVTLPASYKSYLGNWKLRLLSNGDLTIYRLPNTAIDVFLVGGGSAGEGSSGAWSGSTGGNGGCGGYTLTKKNQTVTLNETYSIIIGQGGQTGKAPGTASEAFGFKASGGTWKAGGSGGGAGGFYGGTYRCNSGGSGAKDGNSAGSVDIVSGGSGQRNVPGPNGETGTTREFGESSGKLYAGGGGGGGASNGDPYNYCGGSNGSPGEGGGGKPSKTQSEADGKANTGGGGAGPKSGYKIGHGGSGIVIIRNAR